MQDMPRAATSSDVFNAVAEPQRRAILDFLAGDERPVGDIVDALELAQPSVSKHLRVLRDVGLVGARRDGRQSAVSHQRQRDSGRCTSGPAGSSATGGISSPASRNARSARSASAREHHKEAVCSEPLAPSTISPSISRRRSTSARRSRPPSPPCSSRWGRRTKDTDGAPMPMTLEAWPGGRWFRDLGDRNGHFWGHVQAIKRPTLLEITGPLFMSFAVVSNVQYRLKEVDGGTLISFRHTALGVMPDDYREGMSQGWNRLHEARSEDGPRRRNDARRSDGGRNGID